ncbi:hypothetical protein ALP32_200189 [Pseudomonas avellanae]|uniref:Uncharacterized protein n=1 Tax=Pseudomonas avellanae TaxID=46257 RepID=A0A3M5SWA7_9PSED|nr:hypothetical protein ALP32_200189 [Pseudomonas avellanae]
MDGGMDSITRENQSAPLRSCQLPARNHFNSSAICCVARERSPGRESADEHAFNLQSRSCIFVISNISLNISPPFDRNDCFCIALKCPAYSSVLFSK